MNQDAIRKAIVIARIRSAIDHLTNSFYGMPNSHLDVEIQQFLASAVNLDIGLERLQNDYEAQV